MRTIVVTGGAGFIGAHLCDRLIKSGCTVISLDNYFSGSAENHVAGVDYRRGHTKDMVKLISDTPDIVFHLGEYSRVEKSFEEPATVWDLNTAGTFGALEFCRKNGAKLVYAGSSTKFADGGLGRDQSPYAWTKATNTELVRNYGAWYGLNYAISYFYNVYGPGERADAYGTVIEIFRQRFLAGLPLQVVSPGTQQRVFTHIDDIIDGLVLISDMGEGDEFGLGAEDTYSILEVAEMFGGRAELLPERPGNRMGAWLNVAKTQELGWHATRRLPDYIDQIVARALLRPR